MVVDDEVDSLEVAARLLTIAGAKVILAENGQEALDKLNSQKIQFILSDISMPIMDGWEFIKRLQDNPRTKDIPVIALTAHAMSGDRERAIAAGFHNHISKPLEPAKFVKQLATLLVDVPELASLLNKQ